MAVGENRSGASHIDGLSPLGEQRLGSLQGKLILIDFVKQRRELVCVGHRDSSVEKVSVGAEEFP
jgi:hypothetical protein